jgi:hypothetical protein
MLRKTFRHSIFVLKVELPQGNSNDVITEFGTLIEIAVAGAKPAPHPGTGHDPINLAANIARQNKGARSG